jgi:predicted naringenin-chalcone synthase
MLIDLTTASPPYKVTQKKASDELKRRMQGDAFVARFIDITEKFSGIDSRFIVIPDGNDNSEKNFFTTNDGNHFNPDTQTRMLMYERWSIKLAEDAVQELLIKTKVNPNKINRLITISCTGFYAPGLDYYLIQKFNLAKSIKRTNIGFMGCSAALNGVNSVWEALNSSKEKNITTLLVAVEICSIHLQTQATRDNILANMIFADGASAVLFSNENELIPKLKISFAESVLFDNSAEFMGWKIGNYGFEMLLSSDIPKIILESAAPEVKKILNKNGLEIDDIKFWALHPGGRAILDSLQKGLGLKDEQMFASRDVLRNYGNMSSVSVLFILKKILQENKISKGEYCCAVAFGPGLTMELVMFEGV